MKEFVIWKIFQIDSVPIWLLYWWTMVPSHHPIRVYLPVEIPNISGTLHCNFIVTLIWKELCKYFSIQLIAYGNIPKWKCFACLMLA